MIPAIIFDISLPKPTVYNKMKTQNSFIIIPKTITKYGELHHLIGDKKDPGYSPGSLLIKTKLTYEKEKHANVISCYN